MTLLITLIIAAITYGTPLLFGTLGEILTEKSGNLNLGVEGIMFMGGALGLGGVYYYEKLSSSPNGFVAILVGPYVAASPTWGPLFNMPRPAIAITIPIYGFVASVLPVWLE